ncbi:response regulator transcription factor [Dactylosporangium sp. NPDC005555]|uniref:response regulator transcription factor n=1 Tax=Dactylosporangium sp. NPDC005555 TaxID=3154889 RepID=UPI0033A105AD
MRDNLTGIRVVIADGNPAVRDTLRALLGSLPGIDVVAEAGTGPEAVQAAITTRPDVLIMDLRMPDLDGVAATVELTRAAPAIGVLVLSMHENDAAIMSAMLAGARGYVVKGASPDELSHAIQTVWASGAVFGPGAARRMLTYFTPAALSPREREVLDLIAVGLPSATIAARLGLATRTVADHMTAISAKLRDARAGGSVR